MDQINQLIEMLNGLLFHEVVVFTLLATGILFTLGTKFGQFRALTHGVQVVRGKYDHGDDPGAINHFQALSAALSATVGLGNIAGVALAVALGGPGAVFWMWVIGVVGMALKMTEVTQSMLYRNTDDPDNPHGGPMFVAREGFRRMGLPAVGSVVGGLFVITLLISAITGGNMFQAWNVADVTNTYFQVPTIATGIVLAVVVGLVIIGGIKRIGSVAGRIVPFMCLIYLAAALYVLANNLGAVPEMLALIVKCGLGLENANAQGAFIGGTLGYAAMWGIKRALFSSEAGQGSAPIAHAAAKTDEPVREGVVAGLEPFIDTLVVCTLTALVILSSGAWNREAEAIMAEVPEMANVVVVALDDEATTTVSGLVLEDSSDAIQLLVTSTTGADAPTDRRVRIERSRISAAGAAVLRGGDADDPRNFDAGDDPVVTIVNHWVPARDLVPARSEAARRITGGPFPDGQALFVLVEMPGDANPDTGLNLDRLRAAVAIETLPRPEGASDVAEPETERVFAWQPIVADSAPSLVIDGGEVGVYADYAGASLTAHAFDRTAPGLGKWLVTVAAWLFAISTMISWSYYGEQGLYYLGIRGQGILLYKLVYCLLIAVSCLGFIKTDAQLDMWTTLGLGVMLVVNIPLMLVFGMQAMKAYHAYMDKLNAGAFHPHEAPSVVDVVEGHDVEDDRYPRE